MAFSTTQHEPLRTSGDDAQSPAVLNVRRPNIWRGETSAAETRPRHAIGEFDDAALPQTVLRLPDLAAATKRISAGKPSVGSVLQWVGIGLGGLLAVWLIFGGRRPPAPDSSKAPPWNPPSSARVETAPPAWKAPDHGAAQQSDSDDGPVSPELPPWDDSVERQSPAGGAPAAPGVRTARRAEVVEERSNESHPNEAQPLGITVPVSQ